MKISGSIVNNPSPNTRYPASIGIIGFERNAYRKRDIITIIRLISNHDG